MDIDWAPEQVIRFAMDVFEENNIPCTLFATHESGVLKEVESHSLFEIGVHPNFNKLLDRSSEKSLVETITMLTDIYPHAKGIRSHSLTFNTNMLNQFRELGFEYESNLLTPYITSLSPFKIWNGLLRIPINWEDDIHCMYKKNFAELDFSLREKLLVYNFHPVHLYLNTDSLDTYFNAKKFYHDPGELYKRRNQNHKGTLDYLNLLIDEIKTRGLSTGTLYSVYRDFGYEN